MRTLIIGGTGYLGGKIALEAIKSGHEAIALVRPNSDTSKLEGLGVTTVRGDITELHTWTHPAIPAFAKEVGRLAVSFDAHLYEVIEVFHT